MDISEKELEETLERLQQHEDEHNQFEQHLNDEIIESVKTNKFHVYAVSTIDEGIEILTGVPAGKQNKDGKFPAGTINYLVYEKLRKYYENSKKLID